ncbi:MAG: Rieske (2Fe-2S) protein [Verrucomicrobia bacterium]|nr:Rieske (2Fe-2S) protein [Verrucomicrobiota bacterium]
MSHHDRHDNPEAMNRRQFLILTAACAAIINPKYACARDPDPLIDAGPVGKYTSDGLYEGFRELGFFVIRKGEKLIALSSYCTHRKCLLKTERDHSFYCRCHGSTFDPGGKVTAGPATRDLPVLPTMNEKGHLLVRVPTT